MQTTNSREVVIDEQPIICRELTVMQVRSWLADEDKGSADPLSAAIFAECTLDDLKRMTDLTDEHINRLRPSQIDQVIKVCKELNPHFFGLLGRMATVLQAAR